jgi:hypothetical protein
VLGAVVDGIVVKVVAVGVLDADGTVVAVIDGIALCVVVGVDTV